MLTRRRNSKHFDSRLGSGRFATPSLERDFGITTLICASCRRFNPRNMGEPRPETCHACGEPLVDIQEKERADALAKARAEAEADVLAAIEESATTRQPVTRQWSEARAMLLRELAPHPFENPYQPRTGEYCGTSKWGDWTVTLKPQT